MQSPKESPRIKLEKKRLAHYFVVCGIAKDKPLEPYEQTEQLHMLPRSSECAKISISFCFQFEY